MPIRYHKNQQNSKSSDISNNNDIQNNINYSLNNKEVDNTSFSISKMDNKGRTLTEEYLYFYFKNIYIIWYY